MKSFDVEGTPVSCPWFYPVVEQHDVTYHRVKPLAGHRERHTGREPHQKPTKHSLGRSPRKKNNPFTGWGQHRRVHHQQTGPEVGEPNAKQEDIPQPQGQQIRGHHSQDAPSHCQGPLPVVQGDALPNSLLTFVG